MHIWSSWDNFWAWINNSNVGAFLFLPGPAIMAHSAWQHRRTRKHHEHHLNRLHERLDRLGD